MAGQGSVMELHARIREEDGMFWAEIEDLPGCFASGESIAEVIDALQEAVSLYLASEGPAPRAVPTVASVGLVVEESPQRV